MTNVLSLSTKKELLAMATAHEVTGRHNMTKDELIEALAEFVNEDDDGDEENEDLGIEPADTFINKEQLVAIKRRKQSTARRDASGKIVRTGVNLSGNVPFRHKYYALRPEFVKVDKAPADYQEALKAAPMQVQLILKFMRENDYIVGNSAGIGADIAGQAINKGYLKTRIEPANLFAYYRRVMEALGLVEVTDFDEE